jgi:hypothetical protein
MPQWVLVTVVLLAQLFSSRGPSGSGTVDVRAHRPTPTVTLTSLTDHTTQPDRAGGCPRFLSGDRHV